MNNIVPAMALPTENPLEGLSPQEFQQKLSVWFEEKGLIHHLKSYLKYEMINVLKNTVIGKSIKATNFQTQCLAKQALHLLIAEHLFQSRCHFSLSLFTTEVNLSNILPESKCLFNRNYNEKSPKLFDKSNLINILELLGFFKDSSSFILLLNRYFSENTYSLLECLLDLIGKNPNTTNEEEFPASTEFTDDFMDNITKVLQVLDIPTKMHRQLSHNIKICYELKLKSFENQCIKLVTKFKKELTLRERKIDASRKQKKYLEKQLSDAQEANKILENKITQLLEEEKPNKSKEEILATCLLDHCDDNCKRAHEQCRNYKEQIKVLSDTTKKQRTEIEVLTLKCEDLLTKLNNYQGKICLAQSRFLKTRKEDYDNIIRNSDESISVSSESQTEEVLRVAKRNLKLLEEESAALDLRFSSCL